MGIFFAIAKVTQYLLFQDKVFNTVVDRKKRNAKCLKGQERVVENGGLFVWDIFCVFIPNLG